MHRSLLFVAAVASILDANPAIAADAYRAKAVAFVSGNSGGMKVSPAKFSITLVDLNGDGVPEALTVDNNMESCGSHGCSATILDLTGPKARSMADLLGASLKVLPTKTGGWRDVSLVGVQTSKLVHRGDMYVFAK